LKELQDKSFVFCVSAGVFQHDKAMHINLYAPNKSKSNENDGENKLL
jgi:hypothetical protein